MHGVRQGILSLGTVLCLAIMFAVGLRYEAISPGLAAPTPGGPFFCNGLLSSGGDDSVMIAGLALFAIPFLSRLPGFFQPPSRLELAVFAGVVAVALSCLFLASLDCAHIFYTAFAVPDPPLAAALIALPLSVGFMGLSGRLGRSRRLSSGSGTSGRSGRG